MRYTFCIAGTQKSATTSLSSLLDKHPQVRRAPRKEMHYFDQEDRDWDDPDFSDFRVPARPDKLALGDATPLYMWWPQALERIRAYNPEMRFLVTFRDPIDRLFSQWGMNRNRWPDAAHDWPEFLTTLAPDGLEERIPDGLDVHDYRMNSGVVRGYYGQQLERGFELFGRERFHLVEFGSFLGDHTRHLDAVTDFLGLARYDAHPDLPHGMRGKESITGTAPTGRDVEVLVERYRDDFERFKTLSGLDVSGWSTQRLLDGTLDPADLAAKFARKVATREADPA
jgi:hypothetical protein